MHKDFYASGFLYHPRSNQILLQQDNTVPNEESWTFFGGDIKDDEKIEQSFHRVITLHLNLNLKQNAIFPVYNYFHKDLDKNIHIFYAKVSKLEFFKDSDKKLGWFTFKQINKLPMSKQVKQDIIVSQRVIDSAIRKSLGLQTIG